MPNLYLIGMMGSGKSVTGRCLAAMLNRAFFDLDEKLEKRFGKTINEVFEKEGEQYFRDEEEAVLNEVSASAPCVVATGGGVVLRPRNLERMKASGKICYLETSLDCLWERVKNKKNRPLLKSDDPRKNLERIFAQRRGIYETAADFAVDTDGETAEAVAKKIMIILENRNEKHVGF